MMPRFRVLITDFAWPDLKVERAILDQIEAELIAAPSTDEESLARAAEGVDAVLTTWAQVTAKVIESAESLQVVSRMGIGLDNIDVACCTRRGVTVVNVPDYCLTEVAEHTLALILSLGRNTAFDHLATKQGRYDRQAGPELRRLEGRAVGVVGLGNIGRVVAAKCLALGFRVLAVRRSGTPQPAGELSGVEFVEWDELLRESDFVTLHVPLNERTRRLISAPEMRKMHPDAFLINTSRGGLIDHQALAERLAEGGLAGAALDVQDPEPPDLATPPYNDPRVLVTPHSAFLSAESLETLRRRATEQVRDALLGRRPANVVNE